MFEVKVDFDAREFKRSLKTAAIDAVKRRISGIRCSEHGQTARLTERPSRPGSIEFDVHGCCDELVEEVKRQLQN